VNLITDTFIPAFEEAARAEADAAYAGSFTSKDPALNSSVTFETDDSMHGLGLTRWISNGTDLMQSIVNVVMDSPDVVVRLFPTNLKSPPTPDNGTQEIAFRAITQYALASRNGDSFFCTYCETWESVDNFMYGSMSLDEFVFTLGSDGRAMSVEPKILRANLARA
jgi:hypothetical protein